MIKYHVLQGLIWLYICSGLSVWILRAYTVKSHWPKLLVLEICCIFTCKTRGPRWPCIAHLSTIQVLSQLIFQFRRRSSKQTFKMAGALQITPILPTKFPVNWYFGSGEEVQNRLPRWQPYLISYQNDFSCFWSASQPNTSNQVSSWPFG